MGVVWVPDLTGKGFEAPRPTDEHAAVPFSPMPSVPLSPLASAADRVSTQLRSMPEFAGVAQGRTEIGDDAIIVYVTQAGLESKIPKEVDGYPVRVEVVPGGFGILPAP